VGQAGARRLGDEPKGGDVVVEATGPAQFGQVEVSLVVAVEQLVGDLVGGRLTDRGQRSHRRSPDTESVSACMIGRVTENSSVSGRS
jgi:hypothetical protein